MSVIENESRWGWLSRVVSVFDDRTNPIVVKELRQAVQGRFVMGVVLLFLVAALFVLGISLGQVNDYDRGGAYQSGRVVFFALYVVLIVTCMIFIPALAAVRMYAERNENNTDLLYVTSLTPGAIIRGKVVSALVLTCLVYSACLPFMTLTYGLRGIDLPTIFIVMAWGFLSVVLATALAILLASVPGGRLVRAFLALSGLFGFFWMGFGVLWCASEMVDEGIGSVVDTKEFWGACASILVMYVPVMGLILACAKACIMPASANRALAIRAWITVAWAVSLGVFVAWNHYQFWAFTYLVWGACVLGLLGLALLGSISERDRTGPRLALGIPRSPLLRVPAWLFYSGAGGGVVWCGLMMLATFIAMSFFAEMGGLGTSHGFLTLSSKQFYDGLAVLAACTCYCVAYALTAVLVRNSVLSKRVPPERTWAVAVVIFATVCVVPLLLWLLIFQGAWDRQNDPSLLFLGTPFMLGERDYVWPSVFISSAWAVLALIACLPWIFQQAVGFRRGKPAPPPAAAPVVPNAGPAATGLPVYPDTDAQ